MTLPSKAFLHNNKTGQVSNFSLLCCVLMSEDKKNKNPRFQVYCRNNCRGWHHKLFCVPFEKSVWSTTESGWFRRNVVKSYHVFYLFTLMMSEINWNSFALCFHLITPSTQDNITFILQQAFSHLRGAQTQGQPFEFRPLSFVSPWFPELLIYCTCRMQITCIYF